MPSGPLHHLFISVEYCKYKTSCELLCHGSPLIGYIYIIELNFNRKHFWALKLEHPCCSNAKIVLNTILAFTEGYGRYLEKNSWPKTRICMQTESSWRVRRWAWIAVPGTFYLLDRYSSFCSFFFFFPNIIFFKVLILMTWILSKKGVSIGTDNYLVDLLISKANLIYWFACLHFYYLHLPDNYY